MERKLKKIKYVLVLAVFLYLQINILAQIPRKGFFLGGDFIALMMNGKGEADFEDFDVTEDIFDLTYYKSYYESQGNIDNYFEIKGASWKNKLLCGFKPLVGYKFNPKLALTCSYNYYFKKNGNYSESESLTDFSLQVDATSKMEYFQNTIQILFQYRPKPQKKFFLAGGIEIISIKAEYNNTLNVTGTESGNFLWVIKGSDIIQGMVIGGGIEFPLSLHNTSLTAMALYSMAEYNGNKLLDGINMELPIGGFEGSFGLRMYF